MKSRLEEMLEGHVRQRSVPGAVGLVARGDRAGDVEVAAVGRADAEGGAPMDRSTLFRVASITKTVVAAAAMMLVEDGRFALDDPVARWLPELASPVVVRTPDAEVDDVVPAVRPITVLDLLTSRPGYGFPRDFTLPAVRKLFEVQRDGREPQAFPDPDTWMARLAGIPLLYQPGEAWLYNTASDLQGVLLARATGTALPDLLAERVFEPLGMADTGFVVPEAQRHRFTSYYKGDGGADGSGDLRLADRPDGQWSTMPAFPSGAGGLVSTVDDWLAFSRMLLAGGEARGGRRLLAEESVRRMTTNQLEADDREAAALFLEGMGWGFGGSVDVAPGAPWNVPGRYGWVGGTGTAAHIVPSTGAVTILFTQVGRDSPAYPRIMRDFWQVAADR